MKDKDEDEGMTGFQSLDCTSAPAVGLNRFDDTENKQTYQQDRRNNYGTSVHRLGVNNFLLAKLTRP